MRIPKVVLDTNVIISAILFGGKPQQILTLSLAREIQCITSNILVAELLDVLTKKFRISRTDVQLLEKQVKDNFVIVQPKKSLHVLKDEPDNRVLEAASEGKCDYIITGDKVLLKLKEFRKTKIVTADQFLLGLL